MRTFTDAATAADFIANLVLDREFDSRNDASATLASDFADDVQVSLGILGIEGRALPQGSIAKGTNLGGSDIDIFVVLPRDTPVDFSTVALRIAENMAERKAWGVGAEASVRPMVASHPYAVLSLLKRGSITEIDIVPCYDVPADAIVSAVDRTPHHTRFMNENLNATQKRDVRKLKLFMKGIGVYGADVWTGGYSGYAAEVLVHTCGSFIGVLKSISAAAPATLLDPVDANRNVLASVSDDKARLFSAASGAYLRNPNITFFYSYSRNVETRENVFVLKQPAKDENEAANMRSIIQGRLAQLASRRRIYSSQVSYFWHNGNFYAVVSSGQYPAGSPFKGPDKATMPAEYARWFDKHTLTGNHIDLERNLAFVANPYSNILAFESEIGNGFGRGELSELNGIVRDWTLF